MEALGTVENTRRFADQTYPVHELLRARWSPRVFAPRPVEKEQLQSLFEAARRAPSSFNEQPWRFMVATEENPAEFERMLGVLAEGNRQWARRAPVLVLSVARLNFERSGKPNRHTLHDVGLAVAGLTFQAMALGLMVHQMAGFDIEKARQTFQIPDGYEPVAAIAIGYLGDPHTLPESLRERELAPSTRRPLENFVFSGNWGETASLIEDQIS